MLAASPVFAAPVVMLKANSAMDWEATFLSMTMSTHVVIHAAEEPAAAAPARIRLKRRHDLIHRTRALVPRPVHRVAARRMNRAVAVQRHVAAERSSNARRRARARREAVVAPHIPDGPRVVIDRRQ